MNDLIFRAHSFAATAHAGQVRRYTAEPYTVHLEAVAALVREHGGTPEMIAAAYLHDSIEDTPCTLAEISAEFGPVVAALVEQLTDVSKPSHGNRAVRKALDRDHLAKASPEAKTIKLADLIDNARSIVQHDPGFATVYMAEKAALLGVLKEGDTALWNMAKGLIDNYYSR